jgi:hypothetical protein
MSRGLLDRILDHASEEGWLAPGAIILDPFGGIGSTGILGAYKGYRVVCVELEERFYKLAQQNFAMHSYRLGVLNCPQPVIIQGDSRRLCELLAGAADLIYSSPPYAESMNSEKSGIDWSKTVREDGTPRDMTKEPAHAHRVGAGAEMRYGTTNGQLGAMPPGSVDAVLTSPPYAEAHKPNTSPNDVLNTDRKDLHKWAWNETTQGNTEGNLGAMKPGLPPGEIAAIVSRNNKRNLDRPSDSSTMPLCKPVKIVENNSVLPEDDGNSVPVSALENPARNICSDSEPPTFWEASLDIVSQCYEILRPGGHAIWVLKDFIRKHKRVDFTGDWRRLCESVGFKTLHEHHAMLFKEEATMVFDFVKQGRKERVSFFRRNANNKGAWRNYWATLRSDQRHRWLVKASKKVKGRKFSKIYVKGQELAFKFAGEVHWDWNDDIRIDYEVVLCMQK